MFHESLTFQASRVLALPRRFATMENDITLTPQDLSLWLTVTLWETYAAGRALWQWPVALLELIDAQAAATLAFVCNQGE